MRFKRILKTLRKSIDPAEAGLVDHPVPPERLSEDKLRLHLFGADFDSAASAQQFCFGSGKPNAPEPLTMELEGAFIDTAHVEVVHGRITERLLEFLDDAEADDVLLRLGGENTLIIITEDAFGGLPYSLDDSDRLTYLGEQIVDV
jgi:hypothetical protein